MTLWSLEILMCNFVCLCCLFLAFPMFYGQRICRGSCKDS